MSFKESGQMKPLLSIFIFILCLFILVFFRMESRRLGYTVLKMTHSANKMKSNYQSELVKLARINDPQNLQHYAMSTLTLKKAKQGQIIHMTEEGFAVSQ